MIERAITLINMLRKAGIPAWVCGGVAHDIITGKRYPHKDIDIYVPDEIYRAKVQQIMRSMGYVENKISKYVDRYVSVDSTVDIIYRYYPLERYEPPLPENSITLLPETIIDSFSELINTYQYKIDKLKKGLKKHSEMIKNLRRYVR